MPASKMGRRLLLVSVLAAACERGIMPFDVDENAAVFSFQSLRNSKGNARVGRLWQNASAVGIVTHSGSLTGGDAILTIWDAKGAQVYSRSLTQRGTFVTSSGISGAWRIEVHAQNASGDLVFSIAPGG